MTWCHGPPCPTSEKVKRMPLLNRNLGAGFGREDCSQECPAKRCCDRMQREHIVNPQDLAPCGMGHTKMKALLRQQFQLSLDSIISQVTFSSWLERNSGYSTQARSNVAQRCVAERQVNVCDSSGGLAAVSHHPSEKLKSLKLLWEDPMELRCWTGTASFFLLPGKRNIVQDHTWLRKESLTLALCMISLSLCPPSTNHFLWFLVANKC